ncbi:MAG TPA: ABC transporter substrate-binding protein, partial [Acidimicrobiales bacterium]|nr:ABC transporter substrate-binding protein [Acidimicrobiales bacterium]
MDEDGNPVPDLASSFQVERDGALYRFTLRDDARWHDGTPFTSADVKYTYEEVLLKFHARTRAPMATALEAIETPDPRTVVFRFKQPYAPLLQQLDVTEGPILPKHKYEGTDPNTNPTNTSPVGTGPFKFVSYTKGSEIRLTRNPEYFKEPLPHLDEVVMRIIPDNTARVLALENGEVQWVFDVPDSERARLQQATGIETLETSWNPGGANCIMTMSFNLDRPILKDLRVRQAIAHALDRRQFVELIHFGAGRVAEAPISSGIPWAPAEGLRLPQFDRAQAERLLDAAGWTRQGQDVRTAQGVAGVPDGTRLAIDFLHFPTFAKYGELVRQQLGQVGIEVTQRPLEPTVFPSVVFQQRDFDTNVISYCNATDPEIGVRRMYHSSQIGPAPFTNAAAYRNPEVDRLFEEALTEVDQRQRGRIYRQIQEQVAKDLPYFWLVETVATRAHSSNCSGFKAFTGLFAEDAFCRR